MSFTYVPVADAAVELLKEKLYEASRAGRLYVEVEDIYGLIVPESISGFPAIQIHVPRETFTGTEIVTGRLVVIVLYDATEFEEAASHLRKLAHSIRIYIAGVLKNKIGEMQLSGCSIEFDSWMGKRIGQEEPVPLFGARLTFNTQYKEKNAV